LEWETILIPVLGMNIRKFSPLIQHEKYITSSQLLTVIPIYSQTSKFTELDMEVEERLDKPANERLIS